MALAELAQYTSCLTRTTGLAQALARAQTGEPNPCDELTGHLFARPALPAAPRQTWIATDDQPHSVEPWTTLAPIPPGWHLITQSEAAALQRSGAVSISFPGAAAPRELTSQAAALAYASPSPDVVRERRQPRTPRSPRAPRVPRGPRAPRAARIARPERAPRARRPGRPARPPRVPRKPRPRRPKNYKTKVPPGVCKGPGCHCWTPSGCAGSWYLAILESEAFKDCYKGPCYDYTACVTDRCSIHPDCLASIIKTFWMKQYRAVVANPIGAITADAKAIAAEARRLGVLITRGAEIFTHREVALEPDAVTEGCPPGTRWAVGLTGYSCQTPATHPIAATREQLIAAGILRA